MPQVRITGRARRCRSDAGGFRLTLPHQRISSLSLAYDYDSTTDTDTTLCNTQTFTTRKQSPPWLSSVSTRYATAATQRARLTNTAD